jgi:hypothetical protein
VLGHGLDELKHLASLCPPAKAQDTGGWSVDAWLMDDEATAAAVDVYRSVLLGDRDDETRDLLAEQGIDLDSLLVGPSSKDDITRSDVTELVAAATVSARNGWDLSTFHMPNVPKMARKKSDSGIDVMAVTLDAAATGGLTDDERLLLVSVKHTIDDSTSSMRWKLERSVGAELGPVYVAQQLRVLNGRLRQEGVPKDVAMRLWRFVQLIWDDEKVDIVAVGFADPSLVADFEHHIGLLPPTDSKKHFRAVYVPGLKDLAQLCP